MKNKVFISVISIVALAWYVRDVNGNDVNVNSDTKDSVVIEVAPITLEEVNRAFIPNANQPYNRKNWRHWIDADRDGQDTRQEVLIAENLAHDSLTEYNEDSSRITLGSWVCMFTGDTTTNPRDLDVDHFVPLKEAYLSGASVWSKEQKSAYANEMLSNDNHLIAVMKGANRSKGAKDPSEWLPAINKCWYVTQWCLIKSIWDLGMDDKEDSFLNDFIIDECGEYVNE